MRNLLRRPEAALFAIVFSAYAYFYQGGGWNQNSRLALTRSIVERGAIEIDAYHATTGDKALREGHYYCDKAPGLSCLAVPAYAALWTAAGSAPPSLPFLTIASYASTLFAVALPSALGVVALSLASSALGVGRAGAAFVALAYGLGTLAFPYSTTLFGHQLAAALICGALALLLRARRGASSIGTARLIAIGCLLGVAIAVEYPSSLAATLLVLYAAGFVRPYRRLGWIAAGACGPLAALAAYHSIAFGGPFTTAYSFSTLEDRHQGFFMGIGRLDPSVVWQILFSSYRGLFYSAPWLLTALPGIALLLARRDRRAEGALCAAVPIAFVWMNGSLVDWQGGWTFGPRHLVPSLPFLALAAAAPLATLGRPRWERCLGRALWTLAVPLVAYSAFLMLVATAVRVDVPLEIREPFAHHLLPAFFDGRIAESTHAPDSYHFRWPQYGVRFAWNLGEVIGLSGLATLIPLAGILLLGLAWLSWTLLRPTPAALTAAAVEEGSGRFLQRPAALVAASVAFGFIALGPEWWIAPPEINDNVLHMALTEYAASHWAEHWPVDHWFPSISAGFAMFASYPHLSHLTTATIAHLLSVPEQAPRLYGTFRFVLLALLPLSIFVSLRRLGTGDRAAACAALLYPLITAGFDGIGWSSYVWRGHGLVPQLWSSVLLFPALAWGYTALRSGRCHGAALLLAGCALAHYVYGYMAALSLALLALPFDPGVPRRTRLARLAAIAALTAAMTAYFALPLALDADEMLKSRWAETWRWDSMGWRWVLSRLATGQLFDAGPVPVVSLLVGAGVAVALRRSLSDREPLSRWLLSCFVLWIVLSFGRASFGRAIDLLPFASGLHMNRFLGGVQVFGLIFAGVGTAAIWDRVSGARAPLRAAAGAALLALLCVPAWRQIEYARQNTAWAAGAAAARSAAPELDLLVSDLRDLPPGRVHAGFHGTWGRDFKVGGIPLYAQLQAAGLDMIGYLYMAMARPAEWQMRLDYRRPDHDDLYNLRYVVAPPTLRVPEFALPRGRRGDLMLYEIPTGGYCTFATLEGSPSARAKSSLHGDWEEVYQLGDKWLQGDAPARREFIALNDGAARGANGSGVVLDERIAAGSYRCRVASHEDASLVLKVTYHPSWRARIDGTPAAVTQVIPGFMAVRVGPGVHDVSFTYGPRRWKKGLFYLAVAVAAAGPLVAATRVLSRRAS